MKGFLCAAFILAGCSFAVAQAKYQVLYNFGANPNDGFGAGGSLAFDSSGNLYGTTSEGGEAGHGTVYQLSPAQNGSWTETILYSFCSNGYPVCPDGYQPNTVVVDAAGRIFGTAPIGGDDECLNGHFTTGCGVVFELSPPTQPSGTWTYSVLYTFTGLSDGGFPDAPLLIDAAGNLYGTTAGGGMYAQNAGQGTVFRLKPSMNDSWTESVLYTFCKSGYPTCADGASPNGLVFDSSGNLYGTTAGGGIEQYTVTWGVAYKLFPDGSQEVLHTFGPHLGGDPYEPVVLDAAGNAYGVLGCGGPYAHNGQCGYGGLFRLSSKSGYRQTSLFFDKNNGWGPMGVLLQHGALYGTTYSGGDFVAGTFFEIKRNAKHVIYNFCPNYDCSTGGPPSGDIIADTAGNMYGVTNSGGTYGLGVVYEITP